MTFGNTPLTLKLGILAEGKMLPCTKGLVRHDLLPGYCIPGNGMDYLLPLRLTVRNVLT
ncbi:hypothetical protein LEH88_15045, partial [Salmonella enterica]|nr:hypothetical protein [Salmonella enterica]